MTTETEQNGVCSVIICSYLGVHFLRTKALKGFQALLLTGSTDENMSQINNLCLRSVL